MLWIVTNYGGGKNYTPSVFSDKEKAIEWMNTLSTNIIENGNYDDYMVEKNKNEIVIGDPDEGGNILQLFEYKDYSIN